MDESQVTVVRRLFVSNLNIMLGEDLPSEAEVTEKAKMVRQMIAVQYPLTDEEFIKVLNYAKSEITFEMEGQGAVIEDRHSGHKPWVISSRGDIDWFFWNRFKKYLEMDKDWSTRMTANLHRESDKILDLLGNPRSNKPFLRRGLVLGDVQSGKTANYTALCNKAADAGYRVIIVLTGMQEDLRQQTQERLDTEFAGRNSAAFLDPTKRDKEKIRGVGVAKYGSVKKIAQFTSTIKDFYKTVLQNNSLDIKNINTTVLFVVKKNKSVLNNLAVWLQESCEPGQKIINQSLLVIDDEADNASVNTHDENDSPTAINECIRTLLNMFYQASYVGITATPFANIFISPDDENAMEMEDLFPRDFIYVLDVPSKYIGPDAIFGDDAKYSGMLQEILPEDIEPFFPYTHKKNWDVVGLPKSLYEAMKYFLLINAVRDYRGDKRKHRTMLIHVSRFVNVHKQIRDMVSEWLYSVQSDLRNYSKLPMKKAETIRSISELHSVFVKHHLDVISGLTWAQLLHDYLGNAAETVTITARYSGSQDTLDYKSHNEGLRVIAIGGNSFARGLTLEGLCVTYFYRRSNMYDTLMQMGRWFGYRPHYEDLCRVWTSREAINWYTIINRATNELKMDIKTMMANDQTPLEFGLKVRQNPNSLIVTARNKMRTAKKLVRPISVGGHLLETPRLKLNKLGSNKKILQKFIESLSTDGILKKHPRCAYYWQGVSKELVANLLSSFETNPWHLSFQGDALSEYILNKMDDKKWDIAIPQGLGQKYKEFTSGEMQLEIKMLLHKVTENEGKVMISGSKARVGSAGYAAIGLTEAEKTLAVNAFKSIDGNEKKSVPDSAYLIQDRNPLLLIYAVEVKEPDKYPRLPKVIFALGVGFPRNGNKEATATYVINLTEYRNSLAEDKEKDDDV